MGECVYKEMGQPPFPSPPSLSKHQSRIMCQVRSGKHVAENAGDPQNFSVRLRVYMKAGHREERSLSPEGNLEEQYIQEA